MWNHVVLECRFYFSFHFLSLSYSTYDIQFLLQLASCFQSQTVEFQYFNFHSIFAAAKGFVSNFEKQVSFLTAPHFDYAAAKMLDEIVVKNLGSLMNMVSVNLKSCVMRRL